VAAPPKKKAADQGLFGGMKGGFLLGGNQKKA